MLLLVITPRVTLAVYWSHAVNFGDILYYFWHFLVWRWEHFPLVRNESFCSETYPALRLVLAGGGDICSRIDPYTNAAKWHGWWWGHSYQCRTADLSHKANVCFALHTNFRQKCLKLRVSWFLCIGRLVSKTDNVMHFTCLVKQASVDLVSDPFGLWAVCYAAQSPDATQTQ